MKNLRKSVEKLLKEIDNIRTIQDKLLNTEVNKELNAMTGNETSKPSDDDPGIGEIFKMKIATKGDKTQYELYKQLRKLYQNILDIAIELNSNLDEPFENLLKIQEAKEKDIINVKEFELLYQYSSNSQANFRGRLHDPLPSLQLSHSSKILYKKEEIEKWIENNTI